MRLKLEPVKKKIFELEGEAGEILLSLTVKNFKIGELDEVVKLEATSAKIKNVSEVITKIGIYCEDLTPEKIEFIKGLDVGNGIRIMKALADLVQNKTPEEKKSQ